eukprot:2028346-Pyramimonas_sp.AAC.1
MERLEGVRSHQSGSRPPTTQNRPATINRVNPSVKTPPTKCHTYTLRTPTTTPWRFPPRPSLKRSGHRSVPFCQGCNYGRSPIALMASQSLVVLPYRNGVLAVVTRGRATASVLSVARLACVEKLIRILVISACFLTPSSIAMACTSRFSFFTNHGLSASNARSPKPRRVRTLVVKAGKLADAIEANDVNEFVGKPSTKKVAAVYCVYDSA